MAHAVTHLPAWLRQYKEAQESREVHVLCWSKREPPDLTKESLIAIHDPGLSSAAIQKYSCFCRVETASTAALAGYVTRTESKCHDRLGSRPRLATAGCTMWSCRLTAKLHLKLWYHQPAAESLGQQHMCSTMWSPMPLDHSVTQEARLVRQFLCHCKMSKILVFSCS